MALEHPGERERKREPLFNEIFRAAVRVRVRSSFRSRFTRPSLSLSLSPVRSAHDKNPKKRP